jgi:hypothetical protein
MTYKSVKRSLTGILHEDGFPCINGMKRPEYYARNDLGLVVHRMLQVASLHPHFPAARLRLVEQ